MKSSNTRWPGAAVKLVKDPMFFPTKQFYQAGSCPLIFVFEFLLFILLLLICGLCTPWPNRNQHPTNLGCGLEHHSVLPWRLVLTQSCNRMMDEGTFTAWKETWNLIKINLIKRLLTVWVWVKGNGMESENITNNSRVMVFYKHKNLKMAHGMWVHTHGNCMMHSFFSSRIWALFLISSYQIGLGWR